jgi:alpha-tubulin suppressor-like RCC1 family protein
VSFPTRIAHIEASSDTSFAVAEDGKLYSWPVGGEEQFSEDIPYEIRIPTSVSQVSVGGQFAIVLGTNGGLYSFGQNQCG